MLGSEIAVIAPDRELYSLLEEIRQEFPEPFSLHLGFLDEGVAVAHELLNKGAKVLISRGGTTKKIRSSGINLPLIDIAITEYDVLRLLDQARKISSRIAVVGVDSLIKGADDVAPILGIEVEKFLVHSEKDVKSEVHRAQQMGIQVVVGAKLAVETALGLGLHGILLKSQKEPVVSALKESVKVLDAIRKERELGDRVQAIINSIQEGLLSLDKNGRVIHYNRVAAKALHLASTSIEGELLEESGIYQAIKNREKWVGEIREFWGVKYVCNINHISANGENLGAVIVFQELSQLQTLEQRVRRNLYEKGHIAKHHFEDIIYADPVMGRIIEKAKNYANNDSTILIEGESGTGKEMFAQSLHNESRRKSGPFVAVNCAVLPKNLLESELFGYVEGAFTGAKKGGKAGLFELAHGGTLFLDEIAEITPVVQASLLRVLEERRIMRIGDDKVIPIDVRIICATNKGLYAEVKKGNFRDDLFYRINILKLELPPLRSRIEDIPVLFSHFLKRISKVYGWNPPGIKIEYMSTLKKHFWPGNIRELRNLVERLIINVKSGEINYQDILNELEEFAGKNLELENRITEKKEYPLIDHAEMNLILEVLEQTKGNKTEAARKLGISTTTLWRKLKQYNRN